MKRLLQTSLMIFVFTGLSTVALAQSVSDGITASATVDLVLSVTPGNPLSFGTVLLGTSTSVAPGDAGAGTFTVTSNSGSLTLSFTSGLPSNLTEPNTLENLPISFGAGEAAWGNGSATNLFNPSSDTPNLSMSSGASSDDTDGDGSIDVFIGGTVTTAANQAPGTYEGTITLTATHN